MKHSIAFISEHASPLALLGGADNGGQNVYVAELALQLAKQGYLVDIFTRRDHAGDAEVHPFAPGVRVILVTAGPARVIAKEELTPYMPSFRQEMEKFIRLNKLSYELIHANFFMSGLVAMELKERLDLPFVITFHALGHIRALHQGDMDKFPKERIDMERQIVKNADKIIAECPQDKSDLIEYYQAAPEKIVSIPCGFNPSQFYPVSKAESRALLGFDSNESLVLQLGRMVMRKGIDNLVEAFAALDHRSPKRLVIVGGPDTALEEDAEYKRLNQLTAKLGISDKVYFAGRKNREELSHFYSAADVFVTTPWYEPFGITPLESMACGTPVIGSRVGGIKHTVVDGKTGYLVDPKKPAELADKLNELLSNPGLLSEMSQKAIEHVNHYFTWEKVAEEMAKCYNSIRERKFAIQSQELNMIGSAFEEAAFTFQKAAQELASLVSAAGCKMAATLKAGNKILVCGNGGSAAESQHFVAELVGRFEIPHRKGLPAISLNSDTTIITAWANDFGYDDVFARQVQAFGNEGDILLCLSTSGNSPNTIKAMQMARKKGLQCITMLGKDGGKAAEYGHINLIVPSDSTQRIQEVHLHLVHLLCTIIENRLFNVLYTNKTSAKERQLAVKTNLNTDFAANGSLIGNYGS
ncbi:glycosyltransferase [Pedobacter sp. Leaf176]|uniref:glycosyltransferase n=1 Tax=Pedobacter sp. Leaf176 TaxID=1736286 RepID=UPI0006F21C5D|nr:glycosyltransferase [Pedobacter sp. Leaf176]KQR67249.1 phosphoheptose isomerase [Pedobacter sp. Leaf176]